MTKTELVQAIARKTGRTIAEVEDVINASIDVMGMALACNESVNIRGFGKFEPRERAAHVKINPKTREEIKVPDSRTVAFVPSPTLKRRLT